MTFPYRQVFQQVEESLIRYGSRSRPAAEIRAKLDKYKTVPELTDDNCFSILVKVVFYCGFRAATVDAREEAIDRWFPDWRTVAEYSDDDVEKIMSDPGMIRHKQKITACIHNAKVMKQLIQSHGSFAQYIAYFGPADSSENLRRLKSDLIEQFRYIGEVTVYHFLKDIGMPVLKPDRVICRIFHRLGLIESEGQLCETIAEGRKFAEATGWPIRYIDFVFVVYGQAQTEEVGIDRGICLKKPRCHECGVREFCRWYQTSANKPSQQTAPVSRLS
jgi:DNA-3-methyladenine glycosylase I